MTTRPPKVMPTNLDLLDRLAHEASSDILGVWVLDQRRFAKLLEKEFEAKHFSAGYTAGRSDGIVETVQQCIDIVAQAVDQREPASTYVDKIKQHFGVDE